MAEHTTNDLIRDARSALDSKFPKGIPCLCGGKAWDVVDVTLAESVRLEGKALAELKICCRHCALLLSFLVSPRSVPVLRGDPNASPAP